MDIRIYNGASYRSTRNWNKTKYFNGTVIKIRSKGNLLGSVIVDKNWIKSLVVNPKFRKNGYGKILLNAAEKIIFSKFKEVKLIPQENDDNLRKWYEKNGYTSIPIDVEGYEEENKEYWVMTKCLKLVTK